MDKTFIESKIENLTEEKTIDSNTRKSLEDQIKSIDQNILDAENAHKQAVLDYRNQILELRISLADLNQSIKSNTNKLIILNELLADWDN